MNKTGHSILWGNVLIKKNQQHQRSKKCEAHFKLAVEYGSAGVAVVCEDCEIFSHANVRQILDS